MSEKKEKEKKFFISEPGACVFSASITQINPLANKQGYIPDLTPRNCSTKVAIILNKKYAFQQLYQK